MVILLRDKDTPDVFDCFTPRIIEYPDMVIERSSPTDNKGKATIKNLEARVYFLYVTKDDMNNVGGGVRTDTLVEGKVNKLNVVIE